MKELRGRALNFILENLNEDGSLNLATHYYDYFEVIDSLISIKDFDNARKILLFLGKSQIERGGFFFEPLLDDPGYMSPIFYLNSLSKFLITSNSKDDLSIFNKLLKKSILGLRNYFDEDYLLFFNRDLRSFKWFFIYENACFLELASSFSDFLNQYDYTSEADELFMLRGKCELGFERYFLQKEFIVGRFSNDLEIFESLRSLEELMVYNSYFPYQELIDTYLKKVEKEGVVFEDIAQRLSYYLLLKYQNKEYKKFLKKDLKFLVEIPSKLVTKNFVDSTYKSLFHKSCDMKEIKGKKQKVVLETRNRLRVAALILRLLN